MNSRFEYYRHEVALILNVKNPRLAWKRNIKNLASKYGSSTIAELLSASYIGIEHLTEEDIIKFIGNNKSTKRSRCEHYEGAFYNCCAICNVSGRYASCRGYTDNCRFNRK